MNHVYFTNRRLGRFRPKALKCLAFCGSLLLIFVFLISPASAEAVSSTTWAKDGQSFVELIQLEGYADTSVADKVNQAIRQAAQPYLDSLTVLDSGVAGSLKSSMHSWMFKSGNGHDLLSVLLTAEGRMPSGRTGFVQLPMMFDLSDGSTVEQDKLFTDPEAARAWIEQNLEDIFAQDLSNYLDLEALTPAPMDRLLLTDTGLSLYYPEGSLSWLSGRSASISYLLHELQPLLNLEEGSFLHALGFQNRLNTTDETAQLVETSAKEGRLPGLAVSLGEELNKVIEAHRLLHDPEGFPEGQKYQLEDDAYRGTLILSRDEQTVSGILSRRCNLFGLITGQTTGEQAEAALGQPFVSLPLSQAAAALYGQQEGRMSTYLFEQHELRLLFDSLDILQAIWLNIIK